MPYLCCILQPIDKRVKKLNKKNYVDHIHSTFFVTALNQNLIRSRLDAIKKHNLNLKFVLQKKSKMRIKLWQLIHDIHGYEFGLFARAIKHSHVYCLDLASHTKGICRMLCMLLTKCWPLF